MRIHELHEMVFAPGGNGDICKNCRASSVTPDMLQRPCLRTTDRIFKTWVVETLLEIQQQVAHLEMVNDYSQ